MEIEDLISRLRLAAIADGQPTAACPDDHEVAAYVDGRLEQTNLIERHLADCTSCINLIGELSNQRNSDSVDPVPELLLAHSRQLAKRSDSGWMRFTPHLMAAAIAVVSISVVIHFLQLPESSPTALMTPKVRTTRNNPPRAVQLQVLSPTPGEAVAADELLFHWLTIPGSHYYEIHIVSDTGQRVSEHRVTDTEWRPDPSLPLKPGTEYFVRIDAYASGSSAISSGHIPFRIADPP